MAIQKPAITGRTADYADTTTTICRMNNLPTELLHECARFLDERTLLRLRLVSRRCQCVFTPFVVQFAGIGVAILPESFLPRSSSYALDPRPFHSIPGVFLNNVKTLFVTIKHHGVSPSHPGLFVVWEELARLKSVIRFHISWTPRQENHSIATDQSLPLFSKIMDHVVEATSGRLKNVYIYSRSSLELPELPNALERIDCLETFCYDGVCNGHPCRASSRLPSQIRRIIDNNPSIRSLSIDYPCHGFPLSLHDVFPPELTSMDLSSLVIESPIACPIQCGPLRLPSLHHLRDLTLTQRERIPSMNVEQLWIAFKESNVTLERLSTDHSSSALLEYIASFQGLKSCRLWPKQPNLTGTSNISLHRALSAHATTLEVIRIRPSTVVEAGAWFSFSPFSWAESRTPFLRLRHLDVHTAPDLDLTLDNCQHIADFLAGFPSIYSVRIHWTKELERNPPSPRSLYNAIGRPPNFSITHKSEILVFRVHKRGEATGDR